MNKTADEMLEELGYDKNEYNVYIIYHNKNKSIVFMKNIQSIISRGNGYPEYIDMQELQAINKKVEELGWKK